MKDKEEKPKVYEEHVSKALGLKYVTTDTYFLTETGVMFKHAEVRGMSASAVRKEYEKRLEGTLYDYAYLRNHGFLRKSRNARFIRARAAVLLEKLNSKTAKAVDLGASKASYIMSHFSALTVLRASLVVVGIVAVTMSADFTVEFLLASNPAHRAVRLSWTMVVFAVMALDLVVFFFRKAGWYYILATLFAALWVAVTGFSMFSTMEVQYRGYKDLTDKMVEDNSGANAARVRLSVIDSRIEALSREVESGRQAIDAYVSRENYGVWWLTELQKEQTERSQRMDTLLAEKEALLIEQPDAVIVQEVRDDTFYDHVENITGIPAETVHFSVHVLPAVFIDIIAPFSFAVATFMGGKDGKKKGRREEDAGSGRCSIA